MPRELPLVMISVMTGHCRRDPSCTSSARSARPIGSIQNPTIGRNMLVQMAISRTREYAADKWAHTSAETLDHLPQRWIRSMQPRMRSRMSEPSRIPQLRICSLSIPCLGVHGQSVLYSSIDRKRMAALEQLAAQMGVAQSSRRPASRPWR